MLAFEVLPQLARDAQSESLAHAFEAHLEQTRGHASRLEDVFRSAGAETSSNLDPAAARLFEHAGEVAQTIARPLLRDVFHAGAAARTEHYELAGYDWLIELGGALGIPVDPLERNRAEDAAALEQVESIRARLARQTVENEEER